MFLNYAHTHLRTLTAAALCALCFHLPALANNVTWRSLHDVQTALGATNCYWDGQAVSFSNQQHQLQFFAGRKKAQINGTVVWMNAANRSTAATSDWQMASVDLDCLTVALLPHTEGSVKPLRVLLDPGHGGEDAGAVSDSGEIQEKNITLAMALAVGDALQRQGLHVAYTRTNDCSLTLSQRTRMAATQKADIFISLHANYASNTNATGIETYILPATGFSGTAQNTVARGWQPGNRNDYHNALLGFTIQQSLTVATDVIDRGLKRAGYFVLRESSCPAVLLELGFLSNSEESAQMTNTCWQATNSVKIADGIISYARKLESLNAAVAQKRLRDSAADARWRQYLAQQTKQPLEASGTACIQTAANSAPSSCEPQPPEQAPPPYPDDPPEPDAAAPVAADEPPPETVPQAIPPANPQVRTPVVPGTNTIFDFYLHDNAPAKLK